MNEEKWRNMLEGIKVKGKRKRRIRKAAGTFSLILVLALGSLPFLMPDHPDSGITREGRTGMFYSEMSLVMDPQVYYDPDLGMIAGE